ASGHICGTGEESHACSPPAVHIIGPDGIFRVTFLLAMPTSKPIVENATEIVGEAGAIGMAIVSLIASSRNSYVAPGTFPWTNVAPNRAMDKVWSASVS